MPGMVPTAVEALKLATPMTLDVVAYAILRRMASPRQKLKVRVVGGWVIGSVDGWGSWTGGRGKGVLWGQPQGAPTGRSTQTGKFPSLVPIQCRI